MREILLEQEYPHPPAKVWSVLTNREALARWLMPSDFTPEVGHSFTMTTAPRPGFDGVIRCQVLELEAPRRMRWAWAAGPMRSTVTFELSPTAAGTRLRLRHDGFHGIGALVPWLVMRHGWGKKLRVKIAELLAA